MTERKDAAQAEERDNTDEMKTDAEVPQGDARAKDLSEKTTSPVTSLKDDVAPEERAEASSKVASDCEENQVPLEPNKKAESSAETKSIESSEKPQEEAKEARKESDPQPEQPSRANTPSGERLTATEDESRENIKASAKPASGARRLVLLMILMPLVVAMMAGAGIWHTYSMLYSRPVEISADKIEIVVPEGASASQALNLARNAGMTLPRWETKLLMRLEPELLKRIHVGKFRFERGMTPYDVLKTLSGPALIDQQLRIPEGATIWEVMKVLTSAEGIVRKTEGASDEALMKLLGVEGRQSLEGLLAPETYRYGTGTTDVVLLKKAIDHQRHVLEAAWESRSEDCQAKSAYELLILASIIEKETGERGDRGLVSSVFNNRLRRKMALQTDPTVIYGLGPDWSGRLRRKDLDTPTPWNTYTFVGLPPTPISMPSAASIEAAARPTKSNFLYFVARGDGTSEFSETLRQHNRAVKHFILEKRTTPLPGSKSPKASSTETLSKKE